MKKHANKLGLLDNFHTIYTKMNGDSALPESGLQKERPSNLELDIIRSFGWTLVDYEETLYQKFLLLSASSSLLTIEDFRLGLRSMESKGYVSSLYLGDRKAYKRLLVDDGSEVVITPQVPLDEIRLALGSIKAGVKPSRSKVRRRRTQTEEREKKSLPTDIRSRVKQKSATGREVLGAETRRSRKVTHNLVAESNSIGQDLLNELKNWVQQKYGVGMQARMVLRAYIDNMRHSLNESEQTFLDYIKEETPRFLPRMQDIINTHGSDFLLLSLRLV